MEKHGNLIRRSAIALTSLFAREGKHSPSCQTIRKYNLLLLDLVAKGRFSFVFAEDNCPVPTLGDDVEIVRIGDSLGRVLSIMRVDGCPSSRLWLRLLSKRRFRDRVWYWSFRALEKEWLAEIELLSESVCLFRIWAKPTL